MSPRNALNPAPHVPDAGSDPSSAITKSWLLADSGEGSVHRLGNYQIVARLGQGGMGKVYKARHTNLKRFFALKTLRTDVELSSESIARFYREMEAIGRITHANVVQATDAGPVEGVDCLVMEYLEGTDLASLLRKVGCVSLPIACDLISQAAAGVGAIGEHGLVHRDIKPSNLFLCVDGNVKILDLGLARLEANDDFSRRGEVYGTADYIAPEVAMGLGEYDIRADVYSLGCAFYKLLTGAAPFESDDYDSFASKLHAHVSEAPPLVRTRDDSIPVEIEALVDRMLAKDPADRPLAGEIVDLLGGFTADATRGEAAELAQQHSAVEQSVDEHGVSTPIGTPRSTKPDQDASAQRIDPRLLVAGGVIFLLIAGLSFSIVSSAISSRNQQPAAGGAPTIGEEVSVADEDGEAADVRRLPEDNGEVLAVTVGELLVPNRDEEAFWNVGDDKRSLLLHASGVTFLDLGTIDGGEHRFEVEVKRLDWDSGVWGLFYGYQTEPNGRVARYERLICFSTNDGQFYLSRIVTHVDTDSADIPQDQGAKVPVELEKKRNTLELLLRRHEPVEIRLNGKLLPELATPAASPANDAPAFFGFYGGNASARFHLPKLDGRLLELSERPSNLNKGDP